MPISKISAKTLIFWLDGLYIDKFAESLLQIFNVRRRM